MKTVSVPLSFSPSVANAVDMVLTELLCKNKQ